MGEGAAGVIEGVPLRPKNIPDLVEDVRATLLALVEIPDRLEASLSVEEVRSSVFVGDTRPLDEAWGLSDVGRMAAAYEAVQSRIQEET